MWRPVKRFHCTGQIFTCRRFCLYPGIWGRVVWRGERQYEEQTNEQTIWSCCIEGTDDVSRRKSLWHGVYCVKIGSGANQKEKEEERWLRWLAIKDFHLASKQLNQLWICSLYVYARTLNQFQRSATCLSYLVISCHAMYFNFQANQLRAVSSWHAEGGDSWREGSGSGFFLLLLLAIGVDLLGTLA